HLRLASRKTSGVDWLSEGCYVVARPTLINGFEYKAVTGGMPALLSQNDLVRITAFLGQQASSVGAQHCRKASLWDVAPLRPEKPDSPFSHQTLISDDLMAFYHAQINQGRGRNQSLFNASLIARDHGWSESRVQAVLTDLHAQT